MLAVRDCWNMLIGVATHLVIQAAVVWLARTQFHTMSHLLSTYTSAHAYTFKHLLLTPPINSAPATQRRPHGAHTPNSCCCCSCCCCGMPVWKQQSHGCMLVSPLFHAFKSTLHSKDVVGCFYDAFPWRPPTTNSRISFRASQLAAGT